MRLTVQRQFVHFRVNGAKFVLSSSDFDANGAIIIIFSARLDILEQINRAQIGRFGLVILAESISNVSDAPVCVGRFLD